ncbi:hypothetical protein CONPUDRAFT_116933 [Coniophora puteana RWD-64-598 SS2]|uniref:CDP-diacylglycerol--glycerol-3-phosphate 3-phosphatidyltransferase n=1 Tax=Coniophora puteana (strain RWD-64-598) TaxID=741705 RepID=A0A5M3N059_CONPW|nr:uncharacterized protein CONPUDRAFT_116933 [Coniophora puteana RWD-64-598 SS2]EIW84762.1 hypothetical protein CONPUDRAFT_116933 [Coniophora puteana RWD-64-598 SS2]
MGWDSGRKRRGAHISLPFISATRAISTQHLDSSIRDFASALAVKQPCFQLSAQHVDVLTGPTDFYQRLLTIIRRAKKRLYLSSLYIGSSEHELINALHTSLRNNSDLHVYLTLDYNRSTRPGPSSPVLSLLPLLRDHGERVHVSFFRSPKLQGLMAKLVPPRFNEGWGTWHAKIYGSENEVMISGANLNKSYFTNRQDRYIHFQKQPKLAEYCFSFLGTISQFSYRLRLSSGGGESYQLRWPESSPEPSCVHAAAQKALTQLQADYLAPPTTASSPSEGSADDVMVMPIIQAGQFQIREEERCLDMLFEHLSSGGGGGTAHMDLTSGYFGLYEPYQRLLLRSRVGCDIIAAAPKANGFYGSRGISGLIPEGYTLLEQRFMRAVHAAGRGDTSTAQDQDGAVRLREWERDGWTYHAKGIWLSPTPTSAPVLTLFGSTNLNSRSAHLDTELSFVLATGSDALRGRLREEVAGLKAHAGPWRGGERAVRARTRAIVGVVGGML